ncbi:MAG TPA: hypothetical protein VLK29_05630 [Luteimonas sp.]|nr:hypothetical protein [Luteimonas sp.]
MPDPLGNRRPLLGSQPDRMDLRFIDRSVGGRLREMSRLSVCGELRRAMRTSAASMAAIEASLRRHRCID